MAASKSSAAQNGLVYVADYGNNRIQVFDLEGNFIDKWGSEGRKEGQFSHPSAIAIGNDGSVYVGEDDGGRIQHFDRNGRYLGQIGESALGHIYGMAIDAKGNLLATLGPEGEIRVFASDGVEIARITEIPGLDSLRFPAGIAVASDGSIILSMLPPETDSITPGPFAGGGSGPSGELIRFTIPALTGS
jgi:DNA-binding beta-propeller fold protein YncE